MGEKKLISAVLLAILLFVVAAFLYFYLLHYTAITRNNIVSALGQIEPVNEEEKLALEMLRRELINEQGLVWQRIEGAKPVDSVLLESMGQLLEYAVLLQNNKLINLVVETIWSRFKTADEYFTWKLEEGKPLAATSLLDELRIVKVLSELDDCRNNDGMSNYTFFINRRYRALIFELIQSIFKYEVVNNRLVDFYDAKSKRSAERLSLFYIDIPALDAVVKHDLRFKEAVYEAQKILREAPQDKNGFFPVAYDYKEKSYIFPSTVNMVENLLTAVNYLKAGGNVESFLNFIEREMVTGCLYISYDRSGKPVVTAESTAVYALAWQLAQQAGKREIASFVYDKMLQFQIKGGKLKGGFGDCSSSTVFAFDQLEALKTIRMREREDNGQEEQRTTKKGHNLL